MCLHVAKVVKTYSCYACHYIACVILILILVRDLKPVNAAFYPQTNRSNTSLVLGFQITFTYSIVQRSWAGVRKKNAIN